MGFPYLCHYNICQDHRLYIVFHWPVLECWSRFLWGREWGYLTPEDSNSQLYRWSVESCLTGAHSSI